MILPWKSFVASPYAYTFHHHPSFVFFSFVFLVRAIFRVPLDGRTPGRVHVWCLMMKLLQRQYDWRRGYGGGR